MKQLFMICQSGIRSGYQENTCIFTPLFSIFETGFETIEDAEKQLNTISERYLNSVFIVMSYYDKAPKVYKNILVV